MNIIHCVGPDESTQIRDHLVETLPRLIEQTEWNHEVLDASRSNQLEKIPNSISVTRINPPLCFKTLYERFRDSDLLHLYSSSQSSLFRLPGHLSNTSIVDHVINDTTIARSNRVSRIICDNRAIAETQNCPRKTRIIPRGIPVGETEPDFERYEENESLRFVEIRTDGTEPTHTAEDYMAVLRQTSPEATCHVVGEQGDDGNGIQYHDRDHLTKVLNQSHFLINFSDGSSDNRPILEAYLAGVIPVSSGGSAVEQTINHTETGFYLDSPNKGEVIKQLKLIANKFSDDPSFWIPMAKNGYNLLVNKFSRAQSIEDSTALYQQIFDERQPKTFPETDWSESFIQFFGELVSAETKIDVTEVSHDEFPLELERDLSRLLWSHRTWDDHPEATLDWLSELETNSIEDHYEVHLIRASAHQVENNPEKSVVEAKKAIEREPDLPEPYFIGADGYLSSQNVDDALSLLKSFQQRNPEYEPVNEMIKEIAPLRG